MHEISRRQILTASAAAALAAGAGVALGRAEPSATAPRAGLSGPALEVAESVDSGMRIARYGTQRVVWSVPVTEPVAAITFDDGPDPEFTPRILDALSAAGVTATFNVLGYNGVRHPSLLKEIVAAGHEIANHTWSHLDLAYLAEPAVRAEIVRCKDEIGAVTGIPFASFRPPRGELGGAGFRICAELGYDVYIWSVARGPGNEQSPARVAEYVAESLQPGDVLGLHDGIGHSALAPHTATAAALRARREVEVRALPELLRRTADKGIQLTSAGALSAKGTASLVATAAVTAPPVAKK
ncbi:polysaccharide deacetylase family protein [Cumulibacter manganitolerans]|uniref:polysaccharide deacetylase family protein n=1 Tax=Cumulibacter manganitolerans TaxID=1884992 RepID=UPI001E5ACD61|nr:polysaccharide deacetylase family protein [Cumulibacter manganitolerans]